MGLRIINDAVIVDHAVRGHLHTTRAGNPTERQTNGMMIHSVYKRLKNSAKQGRDRSQKIVGDNCPLIYVVKGDDPLSTDFASIKRLLEHTPSIISNICGKIRDEVDGLVAMPSRYPLAFWLAKRIQRETSLPIFENVFQKSTNMEAAARASALISDRGDQMSKYKRKRLRNSVKMNAKKSGEPYSAKHVPTDIRHYFDPLRWNGLSCPKTHRLLLVDDLLATGGTFSAARQLLVDQGWRTPQQGVTWFSAV